MGVFGVVHHIFQQDTEETIRRELQITERLFLRLLTERSQQLTQQTTALASDYAFKRVMATQDNATISSALLNLSTRIKADVAFLVSTDYEILVDNANAQQIGQTFFAPDLIQKAEIDMNATRLMMLNEKSYQLIVVPVLAPEPIAWLCLGFAIDKTVLEQLKELTRIEISLLNQQNHQFSLQASTLNTSTHIALDLDKHNEGDFFWRVNEKELYLSRLVILEKNEHGQIVALIERSWNQALANFYRLQWLLAVIALFSIILVSFAALWLAKTVSKPVQILARGVQAIGQGDYAYKVNLNSHDEMGKLGMAFNQMGLQLLEKEKIRNLLGKVVSPAVANELITHDLTLGGETREITALFTDLAGFTQIAETMSAQDLVSLLNEYLTHMSGEILHHEGVLDKFIGDAIVAFWGAPTDNDSHATHAVSCALAMQKTLCKLRTQWQAQNLPQLSMRIGINTGYAVVGNIGSIDRLDYTMIGDTVNLAARLESANKYYNSEILISEFTYQQIKDIFLCRELDNVRVQGKQQSVKIYEVLALKNEATFDQNQLYLKFSKALNAFYDEEKETAENIFTELTKTYHDGASFLYLNRLQSENSHSEKIYNLSK